MRLCKPITGKFLVPNDPDGAYVIIRHMPPGEVEDTNEDIRLFDVEMVRQADGSMEQKIKQNPKVGDKRYLFAQRSITGWEGFADVEGKPIPCIPEGILQVCREFQIEDEDGEIIAFAVWINRCREELAKKAKADREAAEKN